METTTDYITHFAFENYKEQLIRTPNGDVDDDFLQNLVNKSFMKTLDKSLIERLTEESEKKCELKPHVEAYIIGYGIFGALKEKITLTEAEIRIATLLKKVENARPSNCKQQVCADNDDFNEWAYEYAAVNFVVGLVAGQKKEYAKSAYHLLKAYKFHLIGIRTPFNDYSAYVFGKLPALAKGDYPFSKEKSAGFISTSPLGAKNVQANGCFMDSFSVNAALNNLEIADGAQVAAVQLGYRKLGFMQRIGSTIVDSPDYPLPIDIYDTFVVDKNYDVYRARLFVNEYAGSGNLFTLPDGFTMPITLKTLADITRRQ